VIRLSPDLRRQSIVDATLAVARRQGFAAATARDVAAELGCSSGLIHHYFRSMDELVAVAFEQAAQHDLARTSEIIEGCTKPDDRIAAYLASYGRVDDDGAFQLWLDAWAEAARRPALGATSQRLNVAWQELLAGIITDGVAAGGFRCDDPHASAWRILSLLDGLALQAVAHRDLLDRSVIVQWSAIVAERELGLRAGRIAGRLGVVPAQVPA
jgi:AcrR family transcriptional regulator